MLVKFDMTLNLYRIHMFYYTSSNGFIFSEPIVIVCCATTSVMNNASPFISFPKIHVLLTTSARQMQETQLLGRSYWHIAESIIKCVVGKKHVLQSGKYSSW